MVPTLQGSLRKATFPEVHHLPPFLPFSPLKSRRCIPPMIHIVPGRSSILDVQNDRAHPTMMRLFQSKSMQSDGFHINTLFMAIWVEDSPWVSAFNL